MHPILYVLLAVVAVALVYRAAARTRVLARCEIQGKSLRVVRGRVPAACLADLREVVERSRVRSGAIEIRKEDGLPLLVAKGISDQDVLQRMRNVVGRFELAKFR